MSEQSPARGRADENRDAGPDAPGMDGETGVETDGDARVLGLDSADADEVIGAMASDTARAVLDAVHEEPATASGLADRLDRSLQTLQYHLGNLDEAGLVEVVDTATSEKGREMDVYGPSEQPVVVFAGDDSGADDLRSVLSRLVSGVAFLALASLLVQELLGREPATVQTRAQDAGASVASESAGGLAGVEPGLVFFAGGLVVLAAYLAGWYLHRRGALGRLAQRV